MKNRLSRPALFAYSLTAAIFLGPPAGGREPFESPGQETVSVAGEAPTPPVEPSHARMLDTLKKIAEQAQKDHPILGDKIARKLRQEARARRAALGDDPSPDAVLSTLELYWQLGKAELKLGKLDEGIERYNQVFDGLTWLSNKYNRQIPPALDLRLAYDRGVAHMRRGETNNCCRRNSPDSCLLPIKGDGVHTDQEDAKQAIQHFTKVLRNSTKESPMHLKARWLLNINYMAISGYPDQVPSEYLIEPSVFESDEPFPRFMNIAGKLGLNTFDLLGGAIVDDFTGDDYLDVVVSTFDLNEEMRFFQNNQDGTFTDRTEEANFAGLVGGFNLNQADYDNDGDLDILVLRGAWTAGDGRIPNSLLRNDGTGRFTDVTFETGLGKHYFPTQTAAWADYDNDGDLDLYIGNEVLGSAIDAPCQLFQNNGDGTFTEVAREAGVLNQGFAKGVAWGDYDNDRWPDLYVSNLGADNRLYRNNGDGTFTDVAEQAGCTGPAASFPVWFWDFDNDGILDLYVSSYEWSRGNLAGVAASQLDMPIDFDLARLYRGNGSGGFEDVAEAQNLTQLTLPMGVNFGDLDNDGYLDFYVGTGYPEYEALMPNVMYRNRGGTGFSDVTTAGGFGQLQKGHGVVFADLDNDGDQDVFEQLGGFFPGDKYFNALFENPGFDNSWISVKLVGVRSNRSAIGARIHVTVVDNDQDRSIYKHVNSGGSFGANPLRQTIGLGKSERIKTLQVDWPTTGQTQTFRDLPVNQFIEITEGSDDYKILDLKPITLGSTEREK